MRTCRRNPTNDGLLRNIDIMIPDNSILAPRRGASPAQSPAVVGGNVETSQRIVDVIFGALEIAAASQGTMNNITYSCYLKPGDPTTYCGTYETICGGSGASPLRAGASGVHTHMTNTRMTDPEVLESRLPVRLECFSIRKKSGGQGNKPGGDGVIRQLRFLAPMTITLLTSRRERGPFGLMGGHAGLPGKNRLLTSKTQVIAPLNTEALYWEEIKGCDLIAASPGDLLEIATPGGGGWGAPPLSDKN